MSAINADRSIKRPQFPGAGSRANDPALLNDPGRGFPPSAAPEYVDFDGIGHGSALRPGASRRRSRLRSGGYALDIGAG